MKRGKKKNINEEKTKERKKERKKEKKKNAEYRPFGKLNPFSQESGKLKNESNRNGTTWCRP